MKNFFLSVVFVCFLQSSLSAQVELKPLKQENAIENINNSNENKINSPITPSVDNLISNSVSDKLKVIKDSSEIIIIVPFDPETMERKPY